MSVPLLGSSCGPPFPELCWVFLLPTFPTSSMPQEPRCASKAIYVPSHWHQGILSGTVWDAGMCWWWEASWGRRVGAASVLQTRSLLCPPSLLIWKGALGNGCFLPMEALAAARARGDGFLPTWCLLPQCCVGALEVAGFGGKFSFPLPSFWGR